MTPFHVTKSEKHHPEISAISEGLYDTYLTSLSNFDVKIFVNVGADFVPIAAHNAKQLWFVARCIHIIIRSYSRLNKSFKKTTKNDVSVESTTFLRSLKKVVNSTETLGFFLKVLFSLE